MLKKSLNNTFMGRIAKMIETGATAIGINEAELARRLGVSQQVLHAWKKRDSVSKERAPKLARMLGIGVDEVLGESSPGNARQTRLAPLEWGEEGELDEQTYLLAPLLNVELSAGGGTNMQEEREQYRLPIRRYTLKKQGVAASDVRMVRVLGDSMEDKLADDSVVAIDTADRQPRDGKIYAYTDGDLLKVKYLHPLPGGGLRVRSHNPAYAEELLDRDAVDDRILIHGRVFMYSSLC